MYTAICFFLFKNPYSVTRLFCRNHQNIGTLCPTDSTRYIVIVNCLKKRSYVLWLESASWTYPTCGDACCCAQSGSIGTGSWFLTLVRRDIRRWCGHRIQARTLNDMIHIAPVYDLAPPEGFFQGMIFWTHMVVGIYWQTFVKFCWGFNNYGTFIYMIP